MNKISYNMFPSGLPNIDIEKNIFSDSFSKIIILYPTELCALTRNQYLCLQKFIKNIGEDRYAIFDTFMMQNGEDHFILQDSTSYLDYLEFSANHFLPVTAIYSLKSTWAIAISDEQYGIAGCIAEYIPQFMKAFQPCQKEREVFANQYALRSDLPNKQYNIELVRNILSWTVPM